jgi:multisubunit Na+/H+ antiporter MnhB subunit
VTGSLVFDLLLALALLGTGGLLLVGANFLRTIVLFVALGLLMSLAWVRLHAPDIALAEAAIGAGITGVLLVDALRQMAWGKKVTPEKPARGAARDERFAVPVWQRVAGALATVGLLALLLPAVLSLGGPRPEMAVRVQEAMGALEHPVTAVLLVFRGFDTLLELGVLLLAVLGMLTVRGRRGLASVGLRAPADPLLENVVRLLVPLALLVAGYLLWLGTYAAGGAFQAGVVLGAAGILLWLSGHRSIDATPNWLWQTLVLLGFVAFLTTALVTLFTAGRMLEYPEPYRHTILVVLEGAAAIAIGATFAALFVGLHPSQESFQLGGGGGGR